VLAGAGFPNVKLGAEPGGGEGADDERDRVPVGAEGGNAVPGDGGSDRREDESDGAADEGVFHRTTRGEARGDVAADDAVNGAIDGGPDENGAGIVFTERRIEMYGMKDCVGGEGDNQHDDETDEDRKDAATDVAARLGRDRDCIHERDASVFFQKVRAAENWPQTITRLDACRNFGELAANLFSNRSRLGSRSAL